VVALLAGATLESQPAVPGHDWESIDKPETAGFSSQRLAAVRAWVSTLDTTAM